MIIQLAVTNFKSFRDRTVFTLRAGRELADHGLPVHEEHLIHVDGADYLKGAAFYGANASGKTNVFHVFNFLYQLLREQGINSYKDSYYRTEPGYDTKESKIELVFYYEKNYYFYGISFLKGEIAEEFLRASEKIDDLIKEENLVFLCERNEDNEQYKINLNEKKVGISEQERDFIIKDFQASGYNDGVCFLKERGKKGLEWIKIAYTYLTYSIVLVNTIGESSANHPNIIHNLLNSNKKDFKLFCEEFIRNADTGIKSLGLQTRKIKDSDNASSRPSYWTAVGKEKESQESIQIRLVFSHHPEVEPFEPKDESDGTLRMLRLIGLLYSLHQDPDLVVVVDELDAHLHTLLCKQIVDFALTKGKGQFFFTTHDTNLIDLDLMRPDEIWLVNKKSSGNSTLTSLYQFRKRLKEIYEKTYNVENAYLKGHFGGIPYLSSFDFIEPEEEDGDQQ